MKIQLRKIIKKWFYTWAAVDIIICGSAIISTIMFVAYKNGHTTASNAWLDLWPNLTTELLGAWISVRIITFFISNRKNKSSSRWRQTEIIMYWRSLADQIGRYADISDVKRLADELRFFEEPHNVKHRLKYLDKSEQLDIDTVKEFVRGLLSEYQLYKEIDKKYDDCKYDDPRKEEFSIERKKVKTILEEKSKIVITAIEKARSNILEEEFEFE